MEAEIEMFPFTKQQNPQKYNLTCKNHSYTKKNYKIHTWGNYECWFI